MTNRRIFLTRFRAGNGRHRHRAAVAAARALRQRCPPPRKKILVAIFQRGAADGLNVVVPHGEKAYYDLRPTIAIPRPRRYARFRASISMASSACTPRSRRSSRYSTRSHLAIVDAVGSPDPTRSHFDAQDYMESGTPGLKATDDGWMNRALPAAEGRPSPVRAVSLGPTMSRSLAGPHAAIALDSIGAFRHVPGTWFGWYSTV